MSIRIKYTLIPILLLLPVTAYADASWTCSYTHFGEAPIMTKYLLHNGVLTDDSKDALQYNILQNNEYSIIATYAVSEIKAGHTKPSIGATTVIIGKKKLHYIVMRSPMGDNENFMLDGGQIANGDCIQN